MNEEQRFVMPRPGETVGQWMDRLAWYDESLQRTRMRNRIYGGSMTTTETLTRMMDICKRSKYNEGCTADDHEDLVELVLSLYSKLCTGHELPDQWSGAPLWLSRCFAKLRRIKCEYLQR